MRKPPPFSGTFYLIFVPINHLTITAIARTWVITITIFTITIHNINIMIIRICQLESIRQRENSNQNVSTNNSIDVDFVDSKS